MLKSIVINISLLLGCLLAAALNAQQNSHSDTRPEEVATGIYVRAGHSGMIFKDRDIANIGFIVGTKCVAVIDTGSSIEEGEALLRDIRQLTRLPVCYVINTHVHPDHILGNYAFRETKARFIGHTNLKRAMQLLGPTYLQRASVSAPLPAEHIVLPDDTVADSLSLDLGGRMLLLQAQPQAHTDNDLTIFDNKTKTWWLSDLLFADHIPVIGGSGSLKGWLALLRDLQQQKVGRVIPGHGPASMNWPDAAKDQMRYLKLLRDETRAWLEQDGELPEALTTIGQAERDRWQQFDEFHKRNISTAYTELEWE